MKHRRRHTAPVTHMRPVSFAADICLLITAITCIYALRVIGHSHEVPTGPTVVSPTYHYELTLGPNDDPYYDVFVRGDKHFIYLAGDPIAPAGSSRCDLLGVAVGSAIAITGVTRPSGIPITVHRRIEGVHPVDFTGALIGPDVGAHCRLCDGGPYMSASGEPPYAYTTMYCELARASYVYSWLLGGDGLCQGNSTVDCIDALTWIWRRQLVDESVYTCDGVAVVNKGFSRALTMPIRVWEVTEPNGGPIRWLPLHPLEIASAPALLPGGCFLWTV